MAIQTSTSRVFTCDVPDCPSVVKIESNGDAKPLAHGTLPEGWHHHGKAGTFMALHCEKHWYRWNPAGDFFEAVPRIKRGKKADAGEDGGK